MDLIEIFTIFRIKISINYVKVYSPTVFNESQNVGFYHRNWVVEKSGQV